LKLRSYGLGQAKKTPTLKTEGMTGRLCLRQGSEKCLVGREGLVCDSSIASRRDEEASKAFSGAWEPG